MFVVEQNANLALWPSPTGPTCSRPGQIVLSGAADELRHDDVVRRAYLGF